MTKFTVVVREENQKWCPGQFGVGVSLEHEDGRKNGDAILFNESDSPAEAAAKLRKLADFLDGI